MKRLFAAGALVAVGLGAWLGTVNNGAGPPTLATVSATALASQGIELLVPQGQVRVSRARADSAALDQFAGTVLESVLATVRSPGGPILDGCLCWVVSIRPTNPKSFVAPPGESPRPATVDWLLVFVDARTGRFVFGAESNTVESPE